MMVKTHPELPDLPAGYFFRIKSVEDSMIGYGVEVQIRRHVEWHGLTWTLGASQHERAWVKPDRPARYLAVALAESLVKSWNYRLQIIENKDLGDLEGDHPSD